MKPRRFPKVRDETAVCRKTGRPYCRSFRNSIRAARSCPRSRSPRRRPRRRARPGAVRAGGRLAAARDGCGRRDHRRFRPPPRTRCACWPMRAPSGRSSAAEGVDLIHARSRAPAWSALWAARRAAVPFVTTYHGAYNETNALKKLYNSVMARGDVVIANSRYTADLIASRYATPRERLRSHSSRRRCGRVRSAGHRAGSRCGVAARAGGWRRNSA